MGIFEFYYLVAGLVAGIAATVGYGVLSLTPGHYRIARRAFLLASLVFASIGMVWGLTTPESLIVRMIAVGIVGAISLVGLTEGLRWIKTIEFPEKKEVSGSEKATELSPLPPTPALPIGPSQPEALLDFGFEMLPRVSPASGMLPIFDVREEGGRIEAGVVNYQMDPSVVVDWRKMIPEWPIFGVSKCEITSATNEPIFNAIINLDLGIQEMVPDPDHPGQSRSGKLLSVQKAQFRIGRVSPHESYVLYFMNRTKYLVNIVVPTEGIWQDFSVRGPDFEKTIHLKLGRTEGLHLTPIISPPTPPPPAPAQPNRPERK